MPTVHELRRQMAARAAARIAPGPEAGGAATTVAAWLDEQAAEQAAARAVPWHRFVKILVRPASTSRRDRFEFVPLRRVVYAELTGAIGRPRAHVQLLFEDGSWGQTLWTMRRFARWARPFGFVLVNPRQAVNVAYVEAASYREDVGPRDGGSPQMRLRLRHGRHAFEVETSRAGSRRLRATVGAARAAAAGRDRTLDAAAAAALRQHTQRVETLTQRVEALERRLTREE